MSRTIPLAAVLSAGLAVNAYAVETLWIGSALPDGATDITQIAALNAGEVATITGSYLDGPDAALFYTDANRDTSRISFEGQDFWGDSARAFKDYDNLAFTPGADGPRFSFAADARLKADQQAAPAQGIFQVGTGTPGYQIPILREGNTILDSDGAGSADASFYRQITPPSYVETALEVNAQGKLVSAGRVDVPADNVLQAKSLFIADGATASVLFRQQADPGASVYMYSRAIPAPGGATVFVTEPTDNPGAAGRGIAQLASPGGTLTSLVAGAISLNGDDYYPELLLGASNGHIAFTVRTGDTEDLPSALVARNSLGNLSTVQDFGTDKRLLSAELTDGGQLAYLWADVTEPSFHRTLEYRNLNNNATRTIAPGLAIDGTWSIQEVGLDEVASPMVNDNGVLAFEALLQSDTESDVAALLTLDLNDANSSPLIVARVGDYLDVTIDGQPTAQLVTYLYANKLGLKSSTWKDGLGEDNSLTFGVSFGEDQEDVALLQVMVPEPTVLAPLALLGLLGVRRRRAIA